MQNSTAVLLSLVLALLTVVFAVHAQQLGPVCIGSFDATIQVCYFLTQPSFHAPNDLVVR